MSADPFEAGSTPDMRLVARAYREWGLAPIPLYPRSKRPINDDWPNLETTDQTPYPGNIGIRLGAPSNGLIDIDLDCEEARLLAPAILPPTGTVFGRHSSPASHWLYTCDPVPDTKQFSTNIKDLPDDGMIVEQRSTGVQTMFPPSIHPEGEMVVWHQKDEATAVDPVRLTRDVGIVAATALLMRHWPAPQARLRYHAWGAMLGTLLRCGVAVDVVERITEIFIARFSPGGAESSRREAPRKLQERLAKQSGRVPGWPALKEVFGEKVVEHCREWLETDDGWEYDHRHKIVAGKLHNVRRALRKLDVELRYDQFASRALVSAPGSKERVLDDAHLNRLWLIIEERFGFRPPLDFFNIVLDDAARHNAFHPVLEHLDKLKWDGIKRLHDWLFTYGNAQKRDDDYNKYVRTVGRIALVAAVRRLRQPGCKFDEMLVFISETQGTDKSSALAMLAIKQEWFTDSIDLGAKDKEAIEQTQGKWIIEIPEMRRGKNDVERIKAFLSRSVDGARLAYGRRKTEVPRQCIYFGTTNDAKFLRDRTGNRRFWPIFEVKFDTEKLSKDVDQLWAEAVAAERSGEPIRLPTDMWKIAETVQNEALEEEPWAEAIRVALDGLEGKIRSAEIWVILDVDIARRTSDMDKRMGAAMRELGWKRKQFRYGGDPEWTYVKGAIGLIDDKRIFIERNQLTRSITITQGANHWIIKAGKTEREQFTPPPARDDRTAYEKDDPRNYKDDDGVATADHDDDDFVI